MSKSGVLAEPAFAGRGKELEELQSYLNSAVNGRGKTVFVSGEAGSGKTRLVREFLNSAKKQGVTTLIGWCLSNAAVPYFPFFEAFGRYFIDEQPKEGEPGGPKAGVPQTGQVVAARIPAQGLDLAAWMMGPLQAEKAQAVSPQIWKDQTFIAVAKALSAISSTGPVILFVDDVHWADSASLALIHYIARAVASEKVLVIATYRSEALTIDAEGRPHPLTETLRLMRREDLFKEIKLTNLTETDLSALAKNMLGADLQEQFADKLEKESQGNSLFIVESLRMLYEQNSLIRENDRWRLISEEIEIPAKIKDIILQRLTGLTRNQRKVLDVASVIGERFGAGLLASALRLEMAEVAEALDSIGKTTALVCCEGEMYQFDHARSRDAVYGEISPTLRKVYHSKVAENLETAKKPGDLLSTDLAYHFAMAGNKDKALKYSLDAGQDALARWSNGEAIKHFTYVLQTTSESAENAETRKKAEEGLGDAYLANSMFKDAIRTFEDLSSRQMGADKLRALRKAMEATFMYRDFKHLMELVKEAEPLAAADRLEYARVLVSRGRTRLFALFNPRLAFEDFMAAFLVFEEEYSLWDAALALLGFGTEVTLGKVHEALAGILRSFALFEELGDVRFQMEAAWGIGSQETLYYGLFDEALKMLDEAVEVNEKTRMGDYARVFSAYQFSILIYVFKRDWEKALSHGLKALELSKQTDDLTAPAIAYSNLCIVYARLGDMIHAEEYFEKFMKQPQEIRDNIMVAYYPAEAVFFAAKSQWKESNQRFKEQFEMIKPLHFAGFELLEKDLYVWALEKQSSPEANALREEIQESVRKVQENFTSVWLEASLMVRREVRVGEQLEMHIDVVNVSRTPCQLIKVETCVPSDAFKIASLPSDFSLREAGVEMTGRRINAFQVVTNKVTMEAMKTGTFALSMKVTYKDELGETKACKVDPITVTVKPAQLLGHAVAGRVSSGYAELDNLLLGGIPEAYAVALVSPSSDEREFIVKRFLEAGAETGETTFDIAVRAGNAKALAEKYPSFHLFICNPRADAIIQDLPNVTKLNGIESLTEIDIALNKTFRTLNFTADKPKRICIEVASDVLLQHHAVTTRKWLNALLADLKSKSFTVLALIDPTMHPQEETQAVLGLFDGEIRVAEKETARGPVKTLRIRRLQGQNYLKDELTLS